MININERGINMTNKKMIKRLIGDGYNKRLISEYIYINRWTSGNKFISLTFNVREY